MHRAPPSSPALAFELERIARDLEPRFVVMRKENEDERLHDLGRANEECGGDPSWPIETLHVAGGRVLEKRKPRSQCLEEIPAVLSHNRHFRDLRSQLSLR